jgi:hypothetical protein
LWLGVSLLFVLFRALPNLTYPLGRAQATYGVVAQGLLRGDRLYRDIWDIKPPGVFWIYEGMLKLFGPVMWSVGLVDILWLLAMSWCIFRFAERNAGTAVATIAVVVNASWHCRVGYLNAGHPENFLILAVFAACFAVWGEGGWPRHFLAGVLVGTAFWFKYNAAVFLPFVVTVRYLDLNALDAEPLRLRLTVPWRVWLGRSCVVLCGFVAAVGAVLGYFRVTGLWSALGENLEMASRYGSAPYHHWGDYWPGALGSIVHILGVLSALAPLAAFWVARKAREVARLAPALLGAAFGCASIGAQVFVHTYAFELCYAFFAMAWGYLALKAFEKLRALERELAASGSLLEKGLLAFIVANALLWPPWLEALSWTRRYRQLAEWWREPDAFYARYPEQHPLEHLEGEMAVIRLLREKSAPGDRVYVWGAAALIYYLTEMRSPARFVPNFPLMAAWGSAAWRAELVRDLRRSPPAFVVVARNDEAASVTFTHLDSEQYLKIFPELAAFIAGSYQPLATLSDFIVYRRTGQGSGSADLGLRSAVCAEWQGKSGG